MKRLITILLVAIPLLAMAQGKTDVTVEAAGQLSQKIAEADRFKISELKISGPLNGADIKLLQQSVNRVKPKEKLGECLVTSVDLSEATIVEGKEGMKTKANELPALLFAGARSLAHVLLPANIINISAVSPTVSHSSRLPYPRALPPLTARLSSTVSVLPRLSFRSMCSLSAPKPLRTASR